tara:strand:- start:191 stop:460 length:270 start_codon:yes stop_codon:yes gene_type:complete
MAGKQKRFGTRRFCEAWAENSKAKNWNAFVAAMRKAAKDDEYSEARIAERLEAFTKDLKAAGITPPKYPKKRTPAAVAAARSLGWAKKK